jgi:hypothetical protein
MGFFDNYRSRLAKTLENQAKDKSKDPAERSPKKAAPKKDGLAEQLAAQRAKYSTPQYEEARQARLKRQSKGAASTSVTPTSRPKAPPPFFSEEPPRRQKAAPAPKQEVQIGTSPTPKAAKPTPPLPVPDASRTVSTPSSAPKPRNYSTETADKLKLGEDNAVMKKLRERSKMSQEERDKPFGEDNEVLKKLRAAGYNFAKGGKINGAARKGKTKGRFI